MSSQMPMELGTGWKRIKEEAIDPLIQLLDSGFDTQTKPFSNKQYMEVYRVCYQMCTQRTPLNFSEELYNRHGETFKTYLRSIVLPALENKVGVALLAESRKRWANHSIMNNWMWRFFRYLDKYYVDHSNQLKLSESGNLAFRTTIFDHVKSRLTGAVISEINRSRDGEMITPDLIKDLVRMYEKMGEGSLQVYDVELQQQLLSASRDFYREKATAWIASDDVPKYLEKVEAVLLAETARVSSMLLNSTEGPLLDVVGDELLRQRQETLLRNEQSGLAKLLQQDKRDDLARMFRLYSRIGNGGQALDPIADGFRVYFQVVGKQTVSDRLKGGAGDEIAAAGAGAGAGGAGPSKKGESNDQPEFIKALLALHDRAKGLVADQFQGHNRFQKALKDAFEVVMNHTPDGTKFTNSELVAGYADRILSGKGDKLDEAAMDAELERIVHIFAFINDKDVFAEEYRKFMAKRLLGQKSVSNDAERTMIGKLKVRCGTGYTSRMEGMLNDLTSASQQLEEFTRKMAGSEMPGGIDFSVQVLTTVWWPQMQPLQMKLPPAMEQCQKLFTDFYESSKNKRKLSWNLGHGTATVTATFKAVKYEFQISTLQAIVLQFFNGVSGAVDFEAIKQHLNADEDGLKRALHSFACGKHKVLLKVPESNKIDASDKFSVNENFSDKLRKLRIPIATLETSKDNKRVEDDRQHTIEAACVRIMKARKTLGHAQLVGEVINQLHFFKPNPKDIKKRIESLIERDFLERGSDPAHPSYNYLA